ncbi:MAG: Gfo/Idh/MocA family oxidoreductase [Candidatus Heimdallarchaeota archaeon]|nr:Gfo/Idh/MocA family oxidoreductase [Candidatus Heimdallarchaeota archaeon]
MIDIGIIGAGIISKRLKNRFLEEKGVNILWICDLDLEKAKLLAENTNAKITNDYHEVLNDQKTGIVYIGVPPKLHKEITLEALNKQKHVICEKPISLTNQSAAEMIDAANSSNKLTCINLPFRWTPAVIKFKEKLAEGYVGEIRRIILRFRFPMWPRSWQITDWLSKKEQGGALREVGTHFFFAMKEFEAWIGNVTKVWSKVEYETDLGAEWNAIGIMEMSSGLTVSLDFLTKSNEKEENSITIVGDKGYLTLQHWHVLQGSQSGSDLVTIDDSEEVEDMVAAFLKRVRGEQSLQPLVSFEDAAYAQQILQALHESKGSWIEIGI